MILKSDFALKYYPNATPRSAMRQLMREIASCQELCNALKSAGYEAHRHKWFFTKQHVEIIKQYLGDPILEE